MPGLGQLAALVGVEGIKQLLNSRAAGQRDREQDRMDAMTALQQSLTGQPGARGQAGMPGGMTGMAQNMANNPMMKDQLFKFLFGNQMGQGQGQGGMGGGNAMMPNSQGVMTRYGAK